MSDASKTVNTLHGAVSRATLDRLRETYDTTALLRAADELAEMLQGMLGEHGWRERLLEIHGAAHTVINDAGYTGQKGGTLPELAGDLASDMSEAVDLIEKWIRRLEPLQALEPETDQTLGAKE